MTPYAEVVVNVPSVRGIFHYSIPKELEGVLTIGHYVTVSFGRHIVQGVVIALAESSPVSETKPIMNLIDPEVIINSSQIELSRKLSKETHNSLASIISLFLPAGLANQSDILYTISKPDTKITVTESQRRFLNLLKKKGSLRGRQIDRALPNREWRRSIQSLVKKGVISTHSVLPPTRVRPKFIRVAQLAVTPEVASASMNKLGNTTNTQTRRQKALLFLINVPEAVNVSWVYAESGCNLRDLQVLAERELIVLFETEIWRDPVSKIKPALDTPPKLTKAQSEAWNEIHSGFQETLSGDPVIPFLLHGVTGSGKTEIYLKAVQKALQEDKSAIVMVPEISLTPQTVRRFLARFPGQVGLVHSRLSVGERFDTWRRTRAGKIKVIIGPRSALFSPVSNIGVIIMDEFHDQSYFQRDIPCYDTLKAAATYASLCNAICLFGSATPPVAAMYNASTTKGKGQKIIGDENKQFHLLNLPSRITPKEDGGVIYNTKLPEVQVIDMREELKAGNRGIFSRSLDSTLQSIISKGEQAILFLNRRGTASYVFCRDCGKSMNCPRCSTPLTFHSRTPGVELLCHHCGYTRKSPKQCPSCSSTLIKKYGLGIEKVESEVQERFPLARTLRWDRDSTRKKDAHDIILSHFISQRSNVLIGTQMLAKGLDLPMVTLVGIILADVGLNLPDPYASERTFQVLTQVAGRAGRSDKGGRVILQTFQPEHYSIKAAAKHDFNGFYKQEIKERKRLGFPPFNQVIRLEYKHLDNGKAESSTGSMADYLQSKIKSSGKIETEVLGPLPCFYKKINNQFRWQVVLRGPDPISLLPSRFLEGWKVEIDPPNLL
ncbi:primosomal protein N' [Chloroflexota bacterium]